MFGVSIEDGTSSSCGMKVNLYLSGWQQKGTLVDTSGDGGHQVEEGRLQDLALLEDS